MGRKHSSKTKTFYYLIICRIFGKSSALTVRNTKREKNLSLQQTGFNQPPAGKLHSNAFTHERHSIEETMSKIENETTHSYEYLHLHSNFIFFVKLKFVSDSSSEWCERCERWW